MNLGLRAVHKEKPKAAGTPPTDALGRWPPQAFSQIVRVVLDAALNHLLSVVSIVFPAFLGDELQKLASSYMRWGLGPLVLEERTHAGFETAGLLGILCWTLLLYAWRHSCVLRLL